MQTTLLRTLGLISAAALIACGADTGDTEGGEDEVAPEFEAHGQAGYNEFAYGESYPTAPYGFEVGSVIPPYKLVGYVNFVNPILPGMQVIDLAELYNPTGTGAFPEGSQFGAGAPMPLALMVNMAAQWCGPCKVEASSVLPGKYAEYKPMGGEFLMFLAQNNDGDPAGPSALNAWDQSYSVSYPSSIDPGGQLMIHFENAFPGNIIIDLRTMRIVALVSGSPQEPDSSLCLQVPQDPNCTFWTTYESVINGSYVSPPQ